MVVLTEVEEEEALAGSLRVEGARVLYGITLTLDKRNICLQIPETIGQVQEETWPLTTRRVYRIFSAVKEEQVYSYIS